MCGEIKTSIMNNTNELVYGVRVVGEDFGEILKKISNFVKVRKEYNDIMKKWTDAVNNTKNFLLDWRNDTYNDIVSDIESLSLIDDLELYICINDMCDDYGSSVMILIGKSLTTLTCEIPLNIWGKKPDLSERIEDIGELGVYLHYLY